MQFSITGILFFESHERNRDLVKCKIELDQTEAHRLNLIEFMREQNVQID